MASLPNSKEIITLRIPRKAMDEVRRLAADAGESQAFIVRQLLRRGLQHQRRDDRDHPDGEAA
jgi:hypothetical protein